MATYVPAKVSTQYIFYVSLVSQADTKLMKSNPTIAAGDFKVSIDGGALANLGTLPTVSPASSVMVKITLSTSEMAGANATVVCIDAAGAEWCDLVVNIQTAARQIDDLAYPATSGRSMVVDASGLVDANAVKIGPTGAGTPQTARDIGTSVLLSSGTGTGQLSITSGVAQAALTATQTFSNTGTWTGNIVGTLSTLTTYTGNTVQTGDAFARIGAAGVGLTAIGDTRIANLDAAVTTRLSTAGYTAPDNTTITAIAGYLDTEVAAIKAKTDNLPAPPAAVGSAMVLSASGLDAVVVETGVNARQALSGIASATAGVLSGAGTGSITIKGAAVATTRISATTDSSGNRSAVTLTLPT